MNTITPSKNLYSKLRELGYEPNNLSDEDIMIYAEYYGLASAIHAPIDQDSLDKLNNALKQLPKP